MGTKADKAHKGAGWMGLAVAIATAAGSYWERDAQKLETQRAAAQAAAYAKVDAVDEITETMRAHTASVSIALDRTRRIDAHEDRIRRLEDLHMKKPGQRPTPAARRIEIPEDTDALSGASAAQQRIEFPPAPKGTKRERVKDAAEQYLKEAF